jgi:DNA polymerase I-like protein with 3'-5' exonuclease and polymerase domains
MDTIHTVTIIQVDISKPNWPIVRKISAANQRGYAKGSSGRGWDRMPIEDALRELEATPMRVGHNIQDFDERAIRLVYPWWGQEKRRVLDTLIMSRFIYPDIHRNGPNRHKLFPHEARQHSVKAWGKRLGEEKKDYSDVCKEKGIDPWAAWNEDMQDYGEQDTEVGFAIFKFLWAQKPASTAMDIEHEFAAICRRMESWGWAFNRSKAEDLLTELQIREAELETQMIGAFGQFYMPVKRGTTSDDLKTSWREQEEDEDEDDEAVQATRYQQFLKARGESVMVVPTRTYQQKCIGLPDVTREVYSEKTGKRLKDYVGPPKVAITQGQAYSPVKLVEFNPSSRAHIWQRLMFKYGWVPSKFTPGGKNKAPEPVVDEDVLRGLPYPEADLLAEYFLVLKRIGQLATGQKAWLKFARETEHPNGSKTYRIHGRINTGGTATGRCSHSDPNIAQVPKNSAATKDYPDSPELHGHRCRELFEATPGFELCGFDGEALELRMLAHYLFKYDKGEYAEIVVNGKKEERTDPHSWLCLLIGEDLLGPVTGAGRDNAKTVMYADLYGAGNLKRGSIVIPKASDKEKMDLGREIAAKMEGRFWAKAQLKADIEEEARLKKHIIGLDGRKLYIRKPHAALNTLLQSAGAVVMKKALIVLDRDLQRAGLHPGREYEFVGNIHDEAQADILPEARSLYIEHAKASLPKAGRLLKLNCPLAAGVELGRSWKDTH